MTPSFDTLTTPLGEIAVIADDTGITEIQYLEGTTPAAEHNPGHPLVAEAIHQLKRYFSGELQHFDLPLTPAGTPFQQVVWRQLLKVHCGDTASYGEIARGIGRPSSGRAVGAACGRNPIAIVVPCHRIIAGNGALTGYAGGLERKRWLLAHEQPAGDCG